MNEDGTMARMPQLKIFAEKHNMKIISVEDLVRYRIEKESLVNKIIETDLPTDYGMFHATVYENVMNGETHVAMTMGDVSQEDESILVRVQTENITFAMFGSKLGEASKAMQSSLKKISEAGKGVILYLRQHEHNLDLIHQLETYAKMQEKQIDFQEAKKETGYGKFRDYGIGAQILNDLGVRKIKLLTNHPPHVNAIGAFGLEIVEIESI
jgi:3,4-dihydroxy 2-butanone 4-phosphate synthase/GTP cyclohydrolase II